MCRKACLVGYCSLKEERKDYVLPLSYVYMHMRKIGNNLPIEKGIGNWGLGRSERETFHFVLFIAFEIESY